MNKTPDWTLWCSFAAVITHGSLSAAARALGLSQPTIGRHMEKLERELGLTLFERTMAGLRPNAAALRVYEPVTAAQAALMQAAMMAEGAQAEFGGTVRITASTVMSNYVLPAILQPLCERHPTIALEIVPSDSAENLSLREADIAIRMFRPTQLDLVAKKLGEVQIVACAHERYLAKRSVPRTLEDLYDHDLIGLDRGDLITAHARKLGFALHREHFKLRSDSQTQLWELVKAGFGIGFAQRTLIDPSPGIVELTLPLAIPPLEVWLTTHSELFTSHRIRAIYDGLAEVLSPLLAGVRR